MAVDVKAPEGMHWWVGSVIYDDFFGLSSYVVQLRGPGDVKYHKITIFGRYKTMTSYSYEVVFFTEDIRDDRGGSTSDLGKITQNNINSAAQRILKRRDANIALEQARIDNKKLLGTF